MDLCFSLPCPALLSPMQDRPAMQLYQPGARNRKRMSSAGKSYDCIPVGHSPESGTERCYDVITMATGLDKGFEKSKDEQWAIWMFIGNTNNLFSLFSWWWQVWPLLKIIHPSEGKGNLVIFIFLFVFSHSHPYRCYKTQSFEYYWNFLFFLNDGHFNSYCSAFKKLSNSITRSKTSIGENYWSY